MMIILLWHKSSGLSYLIDNLFILHKPFGKKRTKTSTLSVFPFNTEYNKTNFSNLK